MEIGVLGMCKPLETVAAILLSVAVLTSVAPVSAMEFPQCDRPDVSQRVNQHAAKHYVENPGPVKRPDVAFLSYSFLDPPTKDTHQIRNSVCNLHKQNPLSFKWEPVGLAYANLPKGECWCMQPPLYLTHDDIEVLDVGEAHIQFINDSPQNSLPASAFVRKNKSSGKPAGGSGEKSTLDNAIDIIKQKTDNFIRERLRFSSSWRDGTITLAISGETDDRFLVAIEMPPRLLENVREQLTDRETVGLAASSIPDLGIEKRDWIPERILAGRVAVVSQKRPKFSDTIFSIAAREVEPLELQVAIFSNDGAREFLAAAPITVYAPAGRQ
jgi:hypothetical protein